MGVLVIRAPVWAPDYCKFLFFCMTFFGLAARLRCEALGRMLEFDWSLVPGQVRPDTCPHDPNTRF